MHSLDKLVSIKKYDASGMVALISSFPDQCRKARDIGRSFILPKSFKKKFDNIVCTGLGGSAIGADLVRAYVTDASGVPIFVNRGYVVPGFVNNRSLVIVTSYSGNTEETLSAYKDARRKGAAIIAITSGGSLGRSAQSDSCPVMVVPGGLPPRTAVGYSSIGLLTILEKTGVIKDQSKSINEAIRVMNDLRDTKIGPAVPFSKNISKHIASRLYHAYPVIYGAQDRMDAVVTRWRGQLAENAKTLASSNLFPEMDHNEIVGWDNPAELLKKFAVVVLRDRGDHPRVARRIDITEKLIVNECGSITEVRSFGTGLLARMFSLVYIGDFTSYYLAILYKCDPTPVERIKYLKEELGRRKGR